MKNQTLLLTPDAVKKHMQSLFRTDIFRKSLNEPDGYIARLVDSFAARPRLFFEMTDPSLERAHFYTWMGAIPAREYRNDTVHDLYYHHEMWHSVTMPYYPGMAFDQWKQKMIDNEFYASLESEALVYYALPGLREKSFEFPIWVDRFLASAPTCAPGPGWQKTTADLVAARRQAMAAPMDSIEQHVSDYVVSNNAWSAIWQGSADVVEAHMALHNMRAATDPKAAMSAHLNFFDTHRDAVSGVPFHNEAVAFQHVFTRLFTPTA